ncbi:hypothetical protein ACPOL_4246 [Acidisarcina polymorpha]|uniref:Uncharacterized protein n=1 Tax=Acidisarcina polymorpha TaxID=2211140 RepID=A0A2Z5G315_9BACT|nr:hypothetical protein ACPOL_4246 [Acidisarcina polymorpha]
MPDCVRGKRTNPELEIFHEKETPDFSGSRALTPLVAISRPWFRSGPQASALQRFDQ